SAATARPLPDCTLPAPAPAASKAGRSAAISAVTSRRSGSGSSPRNRSGLSPERSDMTLLLTNDDVERALTMRECIDVLERAYPELGEGIGVSRTVSQIFTPTAHSKDALYSFKSMDGVAPFAEVAAIRLTSEILTWPKDASGRAKKVRIGAAPGGRFIGLVLL